MRCVRFTLLIGCCLGALGCTGLFRSRSSTTPNSTAPGASTAPAKPTSQPRGGDDNAPFWENSGQPRRGPLLNQPGPGANNNVRPTGGNREDSSGLLAGSLVDAFNRRVPRGYVQVVPADGSGGRPVEIMAEDGYFVIPGMTPGKSYMLTARTLDGERKLAGRVQVVAPNSRILIKVSEDLYSGTVPPPPADEGNASGNRMGRPFGDRDPPAPPFNDNNGWKSDGKPNRVVDGLGDPPAPPIDPPPGDRNRLDPPPVPLNNENIVERDNDPKNDPTRIKPPPVSIPGPPLEAPPDPTPKPDRNMSSAGPNRNSSETRTAFSKFFGPGRLDNFALEDLEGRMWEFRQVQGKLILLDFWATWCGPCKASIPQLNRWHGDYGPQGLEVIGIACEGGNAADNAETVLKAIGKLQINYRVLLGEDNKKCPVQRDFGVKGFPTMVLLDRNGNVLWHSNKFDGRKGITIPMIMSDLDAKIRAELRR